MISLVSGRCPVGARQKAEWIWGVLAELDATGLVTPADKGCQGSAYAKVVVIGMGRDGTPGSAGLHHGLITLRCVTLSFRARMWAGRLAGTGQHRPRHREPASTRSTGGPLCATWNAAR